MAYGALEGLMRVAQERDVHHQGHVQSKEECRFLNLVASSNQLCPVDGIIYLLPLGLVSHLCSQEFHYTR